MANDPMVDPFRVYSLPHTTLERTLPACEAAQGPTRLRAFARLACDRIAAAKAGSPTPSPEKLGQWTAASIMHHRSPRAQSQRYKCLLSNHENREPPSLTPNQECWKDRTDQYCRSGSRLPLDQTGLLAVRDAARRTPRSALEIHHSPLRALAAPD